MAGAIEDRSFTVDQRELLETALSEAGVSQLIEAYPAHQGFAVPDNGTYDEAPPLAPFSDLYGRTLT